MNLQGTVTAGHRNLCGAGHECPQGSGHSGLQWTAGLVSCPAWASRRTVQLQGILARPTEQRSCWRHLLAPAAFKPAQGGRRWAGPVCSSLAPWTSAEREAHPATRCSWLAGTDRCGPGSVCPQRLPRQAAGAHLQGATVTFHSFLFSFCLSCVHTM